MTFNAYDFFTVNELKTGQNISFVQAKVHLTDYSGASFVNIVGEIQLPILVFHFEIY